VGNRSRDAGLSRSEDTARAWGKGKKETRAESKEERGGHEEVGLGEHETHRARDKAVHEEEDESVEEDGHLAGLSVAELDVLARSGHENTGAEREKKGGRDGNFLGSDIGEHLIYAHIIFSIVYKVIECGTSHHFFIKTIFIDNAPE
jgi:hypothetical protein